MNDQVPAEQKPERKKLRVGQTFAMNTQDTPAPKPKAQLKKKSEPFGVNKEKLEQEKQAQADAYWDIEAKPQLPIYHGGMPPINDFYELHPHHNLHNLNKFGTLMDEITFDEEEFNNDPEKYLQGLPEECLNQFQDLYMDSHINQIINDLDDGGKKEDMFDEKMQACTCCHGFIYKCKGKMCYNLGVCQCMVRNEMEAEAQEHFIPECKDCPCCRGYVYTCLGSQCQGRKSCICFDME